MVRQCSFRVGSGLCGYLASECVRVELYGLLWLGLKLKRSVRTKFKVPTFMAAFIALDLSRSWALVALDPMHQALGSLIAPYPFSITAARVSQICPGLWKLRLRITPTNFNRNLDPITRTGDVLVNWDLGYKKWSYTRHHMLLGSKKVPCPVSRVPTLTLIFRSI